MTLPKMYVALILAVFFSSARDIRAQDRYEESGYFTSLRKVPSGLLSTDNYASTIYLFDGRENKKLISSAGCGNYYSTDQSGTLIGYKHISLDGMQTPMIYSIGTRVSVPLADASPRCGQPSFSASGAVLFSIDKEVYILNPDKTTDIYPLGIYANLTPLSSDGRYFAFSDGEERIVIFNRETRERKIVSGDIQGYFNPQWSPDGQKLLYSRLNAELYVYDLASGKTHSLGTGYSASWHPDSRNILLARRKIEDMRLINSDIYLVMFDGSSSLQLTATTDIFENAPAYDAVENTILFSAINVPSIYRGAFTQSSFTATAIFSGRPEIVFHPVSAPVVKAMDIPYVNQVYDTPDWFNGHSACGPATAIMNIAYYSILPKWDGWCSTPTGHYNSWGRYISDRYRFRSMYYGSSANDPNGTPGFGGFGFMWSTGSPYSRMGTYYNNHGMTSSRADGPPYSAAVSEVNAGYPWTICNGLTTSGHIILIHGIGTAANTVVVNDPYGNKNNPGYPNNTGKNATYDWPGFNNGYKNLTTVYWSYSTRYTKPVLSDTLVDDLHFEGGFYLHTKAPATMALWLDQTTGYAGHSWYAYTTSGADTQYALWKPALTQAGNYELFAFIPSGSTTQLAEYKITFNGGTASRVVDQSANIGQWVSLGVYPFAAGSAGFVRLGDMTSGERRKIITIDAMRWSFKGNAAAADNDAGIVREFALYQNYPNPFNPYTTIKYGVGTETLGNRPRSDRAEIGISQQAVVSLKVYDILGNEVATLVNWEQPAGEYSVEFNAGNLPGGIYYYELTGGGFSEVKKMVLLR